MVRTPDTVLSMKRGTWSPDEDQKLVAYIERYRIWNWNHMAKFAGLSRSGKSCRLRWMNYLRPNIRRGNFSKEEEEVILKMQKQLGNRWSIIASRLPGRTDNEIKNYWNTHFRKQMKHKTLTDNLGVSSEDHTAKTPELSNSDELESERIVPMSSLQISNSSSYCNDQDAANENMIIEDSIEWFLELGTLWDEPYQIAAQGLYMVDNFVC